MTKHIMARLAGTAALSLLALSAAAGVDYADRVDNVELGQALFEQFQDDRWQATARVMAADAQGRLAQQQTLAQLYLAENYAAFGDRAQAETLYRQLATTASGEIKDEAWLAIARFAIERGDTAAAREALERSGGNDAAAKSERIVINALILLLEGKPRAALAELSPPANDTTWALYQRYNFGVMVLRMHRNPKGASVLHQLGEINSGGDAEKAALKDRANVSLGYTLLQLNNPADARQYFEKVQLDSHLANPALLGMGWTYAMENNPQKSLVYWLALSESGKQDGYHLESLLAIPYAYTQAGAYGQAAQHYQKAIDVFTRENDAVAKAQHFIQSSGLAAPLNANPSRELAWAEQWRPDDRNAPEKFLPLFMDSPNFQKSLQQYRLLLIVQTKLADMDNQLGQLRNHPGTAEVKFPINDLSQRRETLSKQLADGLRDTALKLDTLALERLEAHRKQLLGYLRHARFGLAQMIEKKAFSEAMP